MSALSFRPVSEANVAGKRVLLRVDLNVPMRDGKVSDATRIERVLPVIRDLVRRGARVILLSHYGRPKGKRAPEFSLRPVADELRRRLDGIAVAFVEDCIGEAAEAAVAQMKDGDVLVLENLRFHPGEEANDPEFVRALARLGDLYVNDAFSVSHRAHASTEGIARVLPAYAGPLMAAEINALASVLENPARPVAGIVGGAKVSTKISVLTNLVQKLDHIVIGGGMANTFLHAQGVEIGTSLCEPDLAGKAREILDAAREAGCEVVLPQDVVVAREFAEGAPSQSVPVGAVPADSMILDIGPQSVTALTGLISQCRTLLWNGPMGAFEIAPFGEGTFALAREAARLTREGRLVTVAGGGDTVAALNAAGVTQDFTYVSTAGGAFLEWLEGKELPGVAALRQ
ncbi:MAG: phosphoglycerate kinase [Methyloligellaceae bacterium]